MWGGQREAPGGAAGLELSFSVIDPHWMAVARGDEPADLLLAGGRVLSVFANERLDVSVAYLVSGFIDAHIHIESSKLTVDVTRFELVPLGVE